MKRSITILIGVSAIVVLSIIYINKIVIPQQVKQRQYKLEQQEKQRQNDIIQQEKQHQLDLERSKLLSAINKITSEIDKNIEKINHIKMKQARYLTKAENETVITENNEFSLAGLEVIKYNQQLKAIVPVIKNGIDKIIKIGQQNNFQSDPAFNEIINKYANVDNMTATRESETPGEEYFRKQEEGRREQKAIDKIMGF